MTSPQERVECPGNASNIGQVEDVGGHQLKEHPVLPTQHTEDDESNYNYLQGLPFWLVTTSLAVMVFMVNLEIPVVTTSLVTISDELGGFDKSSWVISGYLLGYVAVIVIFAKLSDIFGRKPIYLLSMSFFIVFSAACSAAQTMTQL
ncbi:hypothetical protein KVR01_011721 [Diaporthe batatas]|uniref:uncharacterized protein n=1 Tax=Diaporthe batatas TaxID=748121 RepID=UPI001D057EF1|nr:uncharacterized protein KVR01_011721 [Diaporthe batatas]KAG8158599.1 hypothetical protein KVR01_011721 [Diaporthe batatas]